MRRAWAAVLAFALLLTGCATDSGPRPLTDEEAQRLAVVRLNNLQAGTVAVDVDIPGTGSIDGWFDYRDGHGIVALRDASGQPAGLAAWVHETIAYAAAGGDPLAPPPDGWDFGALTPSDSPMAAALAIISALVDDRAENYTLLQQEGAQWLRADRIGDVDVDVMLGPADSGAKLTYWVDDSGQLLRLEANLGGGQQVSVFDFVPDPAVTVPPMPQP